MAVDANVFGIIEVRFLWFLASFSLIKLWQLNYYKRPDWSKKPKEIKLFYVYFRKAIDYTFYHSTGVINHLGCWERTNFSSVLPTSTAWVNAPLDQWKCDLLLTKPALGLVGLSNKVKESLS